MIVSGFSNFLALLLQVSKIPDADHLSLSIGGFIIADPKTRDAGHHLKKTVLRYALLSWTMCLSRVSGPLRKQFETTLQYIDKKLLEESQALKVSQENPHFSSYFFFRLIWILPPARASGGSPWPGQYPW